MKHAVCVGLCGAQQVPGGSHFERRAPTGPQHRGKTLVRGASFHVCSVGFRDAAYRRADDGPEMDAEETERPTRPATMTAWRRHRRMP
jgi:hypothetical protein